MANVEKIVPFIIQFEAGVSPAGLTGKLLFEKARKPWYANDPDDLGGATMVGVTLATYTEYCRKKSYPRPSVERLRSMTYTQWLDILKTMFWDRWKADEIANQSIAEILVDWVWASGKYGITIPQRKAYIDRICASRPINNKYKKGWLRRLNAITFKP